MSGPSNNPVVQQLQLLLMGYGYNYYDKKNQARADDLLVRQRAAAALAAAAQALVQLQSDYQRGFIPPATRDNPYPPPEAMQKLRAIGALRDRLSAIETTIRGMPVPTQDKVWWRIRTEDTLLNRLLDSDYGLLRATAELDQQARDLTAERWHEEDVSGQFDQSLHRLEDLIRDRQQLLQLPV